MSISAVSNQLLSFLERLVKRQVGHDGGKTAREHGLARSGRSHKQQIVPACDCDLQRAPRDGLSRLEAMCMQTGAELPVYVIREMISSAVNMIVQLSRFSDGSRKVTYITEMHGQKDGEIQSTDLFRYVQTGVDENGKVQGVFAPTGQLPTFFDEFEAKGQPVDKDVFLKNAVPLDATGEPDKQAVARLQQELAGKNVPPAPPAGPVQQ